jgi:glucosyl-dolichyl phosphate glucuronosyltransferase
LLELKNIKCSIIVCSYDRAESLDSTLSSLSMQVFKLGGLETIIVDNNSRDNTKSVAMSHIDNCEGSNSFRYIFEPKQGLSHARNTGIQHAKGEVIIFIDDDAYPCSTDWAEALTKVFIDENVGVAGGDAIPVWPTTGRPAWLHDNLLKYLGLVSFNRREICDLHYPGYPYGVNIAFRKSLITEFGGFRNDFGRIGEYLLSGEEIHLCKEIENAGYRVVYVPKTQVKHVMAPGRLNKKWFLERAYCQGITKATLEIHRRFSMKTLYLVILRTAIILASTISAGVLKAIGSQRLSMVALCKAKMSGAYLSFCINPSKY